MPGREKGTATLACPGCGNELAATEQRDGSLAAETCTNCHPQTEQATEKPQRQRRETGTPAPDADAGSNQSKE